MQLIYEGKDISGDVGVNKVDLYDNSGGIADSLELWMSDTQGLWSQWKPKKNDRVQVRKDGFDSGVMYVDELEQQRGVFVIRALSIPQKAKTQNTKGWESIRFIEFAGEIASKYGFQLQTFGIENHFYTRVDQFEQADFKFLAHRSTLEGYVLKITGGKVVTYDERYMENQAAAKTIFRSQFDGPYHFKTKSTEVYNSCSLSYGSIRARFQPGNAPEGPEIKIRDIAVSSQGEADRFCKNILRFSNKYETTGRCTILLDPGLAAGNVVDIAGVGLADGKYFVEKVIHRIVDKRSDLKLRRILEGY